MNKQSIHCRKSSTRHVLKAHASSGRLTAFRGLLRLFNIALTAVLVLSATSCRSKQTLVQSEVQSDSLRQESSFLQSSSLQMLTTTEAQKIAADTAMLTLPMQSLLNLPDSAVFRRQSGRLVIEAYHKDGNVYIRGSTLPIDREVRQTTILARHASTAQENKAVRSVGKVSKTKIIKPPPTYQKLLQVVGTLVLLGALAFAGVKIFSWYNKKLIK